MHYILVIILSSLPGKMPPANPVTVIGTFENLGTCTAAGRQIVDKVNNDPRFITWACVPADGK